MYRLSRLAGLLTLLVVLGVTVGSSAQDKEPSIKEIMTKAHKGGDSILAKLGKDLKSDKPDWDEVTKLSGELVKLGESLAKAKPSKGEMTSWEKLTKAYNDNAKALDKAAAKKDKETAAAACKKLSGSCMECHKAHKGK